MKLIDLYLVFAGSALAVGCASTQTSKQFKYISYEEKPAATKSIGIVEGRDCSWHIMGYSLGEPTVRSAFINAAEGKREGFVPGQSRGTSGPELKSLRNVSVENEGFNLGFAGRTCVVVAGEGYL